MVAETQKGGGNKFGEEGHTIDPPGRQSLEPGVKECVLIKGEKKKVEVFCYLQSGNTCEGPRKDQEIPEKRPLQSPRDSTRKKGRG